MSSYSKKTNRLLREHLIEAYERELNRELQKLDASFEEWRSGKISSGELSHRVHQYERGPSRELYKKYNAGMDELNVAYAIVVGILEEDKVPAELLEALERPLEMLRQMQARGELRELES
jgi:hypothetical protein